MMARPRLSPLRIALVLLLTCCSATVPFAQPAATAQPRRPSLREYVESAKGRQAYGMYLAGRKVGWFVEELKLAMENGAEVAVLAEEFQFDVTFAGQKSTFKSEEEKVFDLNGDGRILRARSNSVEDGSRTLIDAVRNQGELKITTQTGGQKAVRTLPLPKTSLRRQQAFEEWLSSDPQPGATFQSYSIALDQTDVDVAEHYEIEKKRSIVWGGIPTTAYDVSLTMFGVSVDATLSDTGRIIRGKIASILEIRAEEEAVAKKLDAVGVDMLAASAIKIDRDLGDPKMVQSLTLKAGDLSDITVPNSHRQTIQADGEKDSIIKLSRDHRIEVGQPLAEQARARWTRSSPALLTDHEDVQQLAADIVSDGAAPLTAAREIKNWIQKNLRQSYAANGSTSLQVLANRAGDCTEHALLFVALARAADIPAREVGGVVYIGGTRLFGWHAWAEIHDGHQWVSVDPMWNQIYVDATHLKLSQGSDDYTWINVLGSLDLKVLNFETED